MELGLTRLGGLDSELGVEPKWSSRELRFEPSGLTSRRVEVELFTEWGPTTLRGMSVEFGCETKVWDQTVVSPGVKSFIRHVISNWIRS